MTKRVPDNRRKRRPNGLWREVIDLAGHGHTDKQIAYMLRCSKEYVRTTCRRKKAAFADTRTWRPP